MKQMNVLVEFGSGNYLQKRGFMQQEQVSSVKDSSVKSASDGVSQDTKREQTKQLGSLCPQACKIKKNTFYRDYPRSWI